MTVTVGIPAPQRHLVGEKQPISAVHYERLKRLVALMCVLVLDNTSNKYYFPVVEQDLKYVPEYMMGYWKCNRAHSHVM